MGKKGNLISKSEKQGPKSNRQKQSKTKDKKVFKIENATQEGENRMDWLLEPAQEAVALS